MVPITQPVTPDVGLANPSPNGVALEKQDLDLWPRPCPTPRGGAVCAHTVVLLVCVCDPRVVQWTQQTTTVGVLCSCCTTPLTVREQGERGGKGEEEGGRKGDSKCVFCIAIL